MCACEVVQGEKCETEETVKEKAEPFIAVNKMVYINRGAAREDEMSKRYCQIKRKWK